MGAGLAALIWLAPADRAVGPATFGINSLIVGALAATVGYQLVALGVCARVYVSDAQPGDDGSWARPLLRRFTLERGIAIGLVLGAVGVGLVAIIGAHWVTSSFGIVARSDHGVAVIGLTIALIGMETIFSSFFLALIVSLIDSTKSRAETVS
jgi:hypothetical protein